MTRSAVAVFAAIAAGGCGGGEQQRQTFSAADAKRIANVRPTMPGWVWPRSPEKRDSSASSDESEPTDPLLVKLKRQTADVVDIANAGNHWEDDNKLANLSVEVDRSASDARKAMAALNAFSRGWGERSGSVTKDEQIDGLGDEAWRLWTLGQGYEVTYHWRRGNLYSKRTSTASGFARVTSIPSMPPHIRGSTRSMRLREKQDEARAGSREAPRVRLAARPMPRRASELAVAQSPPPATALAPIIRLPFRREPWECHVGR